MKMIYHALVCLHPAAFHRQFGAEMESIFEEAGTPVKLLADVVVSLARQWILRTQAWIIGLAALGGAIPFALGYGIISYTTGSLGVEPVPHRHLKAQAASAVSQSPTLAFLMLTTVIALLFISGTMAFAITWFRYSQRRRRA